MGVVAPEPLGKHEDTRADLLGDPGDAFDVPQIVKDTNAVAGVNARGPASAALISTSMMSR